MSERRGAPEPLKTMTAAEFVAFLKKEADLFGAFWADMHAKQPTNYKERLTGIEWWRQYMAYCLIRGKSRIGTDDVRREDG